MNAASASPDFSALDLLACPLAGIRQIEASAGTGKTWSLCGLYARLVLERALTVQQILVVTFTNAATAELRERIRARLSDLLARLQGRAGEDGLIDALLDAARSRGHAESALVDRLVLALATFDEAAIFTIHGFCQRALADAQFTAHAPLALELAPDDAHWALQAATDFWRRHVASDAIDAALAARLVTKKASPEVFAKLLRRRLARPLAQPIWPPEMDEPPPIDTAKLLQAHAEATSHWRSNRATILAIVKEAMAARVLNANSYKPPRIDEAARAWDQLAATSDGVAAMARQDNSNQRDRFKTFHLLTQKRLVASTLSNRIPPAHAFFALAQALFEERTTTERALEIRRLQLLKQLLEEGTRDVREAKRIARVVGFDDLLSMLHERLDAPQGSALAQSLATRYPAALIDEFQDTDPLQWAIFHRLYASGPGPLFLIGDPKQAIYNFRNADLHTYLAAGASAEARDSLTENQRSTPELIEGLNALFKRNSAAFMLPGLTYRCVTAGKKPRRPLRDDSSTAPAPAALQVWMLPGCDEASRGAGIPPWAARDAERAAIDATAGEIARLLEAAAAERLMLGAPGAAPGDPGEEPVQASDIAVLVRTNAQGSRVREALHRLGVGSVELAQESIYATRDAEELDRVLTAILEPARERALKAALSTQAMGFDASAIDALATDEIALAVQAQRFATWRDAWQAQGVAVMLRRWMVDARVPARLLARPDDGERRLTNLLHLVERLHDASADNAQPRTLLRWLQSARADSAGPTPDETSQLRLESDRNLVQIVTVHKSKGLEYPFVFCPLLWWPARARANDIEGLAYHEAERDSAGNVTPESRSVIDFRQALLSETEIKALRARIAREAVAEEVRLLYVALTRAAHRCVLIAGCALQGGKGGNVTATARSSLNWLVAGQGIKPEAWASNTLDAEAIGAAWQDLALRSGGAIAIAPLPFEPGRLLHATSLSPERLVALAPPGALPKAWRIGSFSGLAHGSRHEDAAREREALDAIGVKGDVEVEDAPASSSAVAVSDVEPDDASTAELDDMTTADLHGRSATTSPDDIVNFPRGAAAGECIHEVFERIDFAESAGWPVVIDAALRAGRTLQALRADDAGTPIDADDAGGRPRQVAMLHRMLTDVLATPLPIGTPTPLRLSTLGHTRRLVEMEFHLGVDHLDTRALQRLLARAGIAVPSLAPTSLRGWLKGFIDLVFEHEDRWFVLDWKSNHLGSTAANYAGAALDDAMQSKAYHLQATLYLLALDRLLRARLADYDPRRHLGGAVYLFVRGVRPDWRDAEGRPTGLVLQRPDFDVLQRLSAWFEGTEVPA